MAKVLVVDDDAVVSGLVARVLGYEGHEVQEVGDGRDGLKLLEQGQFDLVVTDLQMQFMDGDTMLKEAGDHLPPVAILMSRTFGDKTQEELRTRFNGLPKSCNIWFMAKPFEIQALLDLLERTL